MRRRIHATLAALVLMLSATAGVAAAAPLTPKRQKLLNYL